jgi:hypothetical protein
MLAGALLAIMKTSNGHDGVAQTTGQIYIVHNTRYMGIGYVYRQGDYCDTMNHVSVHDDQKNTDACTVSVLNVRMNASS